MIRRSRFISAVALGALWAAGLAGCNAVPADSQPTEEDPSTAFDAPGQGTETNHKTLQEPNALEAAYRDADQMALGAWLAAWAAEDRPLSVRQKILLPKIARDAYTIFEDFYDPVAERGADGGHRYAVIQPTLEVAYYRVRHVSEIDEADRPFYRLDIKDFRPDVRGEHRTGLFFDGKHDKILAAFLRGPRGRPPKDRPQRIAFLSQQLIGAQSGRVPISYPHVSVIRFNADLTEARVIYHVQFKKAQIDYRKTGGTWRPDVVETTVDAGE
ncbi:MAG: hypothetical protein R3236_05980 [Phycisphaeraceae bacterium]|nr:hypothetical protein [Phycisphaeraceae bacterium]